MTYVYEKVNAYDIVDRARTFSRIEQLGGPAGWRAMLEHLEQLAEDMGQPIELDIIALCCDYAHFDDIADYNAQYDTEYESPDEIDELAFVIGDDFVAYAH